MLTSLVREARQAPSPAAPSLDASLASNGALADALRAARDSNPDGLVHVVFANGGFRRLAANHLCSLARFGLDGRAVVVASVALAAAGRPPLPRGRPASSALLVLFLYDRCGDVVQASVWSLLWCCFADASGLELSLPAESRFARMRSMPCVTQPSALFVLLTAF